MDVEIRTQRPDEWPEVLALINRAFAPEVNAGQLAEWVHGSAGWVAELSQVAVDNGRVVGHVVLSQLPLCTASGEVTVLCLTPLSVDPAAQGRGIARALVANVLRSAATRAEPLVVLEGSPQMYPKFGFTTATEYGIERPPGMAQHDAFQLVTLPGYHPDLRGYVRYPDYWYEIDAV